MIKPRLLRCRCYILALFVLILFAYNFRTANDSSSTYKNSPSLVEKLKPKLSKSLWDDLTAVHNAEDVRIRDQGYKRFAFNTLISARLSLQREIPDTRHKACQALTYPDVLPTASVVICFYQEDVQTLLRTVHSVVLRSPKSVLQQVILVDDYSGVPEEMSNLTQHIQGDDKLAIVVTLLHAPERLGLIRARMFGAKQATGDVLVFLDSHCEVNVHWLEPLLSRIKENRTNVVTPIIDIINADTFKYEPSPLVRGGFNWGLNFKWDSIPRSELQTQEDFAKPFKSPTMVLLPHIHA